MNKNSFKEIVGMALIGEGIVGFFAPKKYSVFWKLKIPLIEKIKHVAADKPELMRLIYAAEAVSGLWLAKSQLDDSIKKGK